VCLRKYKAAHGFCNILATTGSVDFSRRQTLVQTSGG